MRQSRAFLFDMDGVLVNSERVWHSETDHIAERLYGPEIRRLMGETMGLSVDAEYELATKYGFTMEREEYGLLIDSYAAIVYSKAVITEHVTPTLERLSELGYLIGLVTGSPRGWVQTVLGRIPSSQKFGYILSIGDRRELQSKPHPDGYLAAMRELGVIPERTLILEDSNNGIRSAKSAGATVIGFRPNLLDGYVQEGADFYADSMHEVVKIAEAFAR